MKILLAFIRVISGQKQFGIARSPASPLGGEHFSKIVLIKLVDLAAETARHDRTAVLGEHRFHLGPPERGDQSFCPLHRAIASKLNVALLEYVEFDLAK